MKLLGRIPVEQLDDERLTNIERRIVAGAADAAMRARPARSRWYLGALAATMAAAAALVIGLQLGAQRAAAPVVGEATPVRVDTSAPRAKLDIGDATIESDPSTVFAVTRPGTGVLVTMTRGKVELEVGKRGGRDPLVVRAGDTDVIVVGTHFTVDYGDGTGEVDVRVTEGVVKVVRRKHEVRVAAGMTWQTTRGLVALADVRGTEPAAKAVSTDADVVASADDPTQAAGAIDIPLGEGPDVLKHRTAQVPDARVPAVAQREPRADVKPAGPEVTRPTRTPGAGSGSGGMELRTLIERQPFAPAVDLGITDWAAAAAKFREAGNGRGEEAARALYSLAVLQATKLGRTEDALKTLEQFMTRFAHKREHTAAMWLRVRVLCMRSIDERCRKAAYTYMHESPGTAAAAIAERITLSE